MGCCLDPQRNHGPTENGYHGGIYGHHGMHGLTRERKGGVSGSGTGTNSGDSGGGSKIGFLSGDVGKGPDWNYIWLWISFHFHHIFTLFMHKKSYVPFLRGLVFHSQKLKNLLFFRNSWYRFVPELIIVISPPRDSSVITELNSKFWGIEAHRTVEHVTASKIE